MKKRILSILLAFVMVVSLLPIGVSAVTPESIYVTSNVGTEIAGGNWKAYVTSNFSGLFGSDFAQFDQNGKADVTENGQISLYNTIQKDYAGYGFSTPDARNVLQSTNTTTINNFFLQFGQESFDGKWGQNISYAFSETQLWGVLTDESYTEEDGFAVENGMVRDGLVITLFTDTVATDASANFDTITAYVLDNGSIVSQQSYAIDNQGYAFGLCVGHPHRTFFTFDENGVLTYHAEDTYSSDGSYINQTYTFDELDLSTIQPDAKNYYFSVGSGTDNDINSASITLTLSRIGTAVLNGDGTYAVDGETLNLADWTGFGTASCNHVWGEYTVVSPGTCTEPEISQAACMNGCGSVDVQTTVSAGHNWSEWECLEAPGCEDSGLDFRTCTGCGQKETTEVAALGHDWSDWYTTSDPTCEDDGLMQRDCSVCGSYEEKWIYAFGHEWIWDTFATEQTYGERHCDLCGTVESDLSYDLIYYWTPAANNKVGNIDPDLADYNDNFSWSYDPEDGAVEIDDMSYIYGGAYNYNTMLKLNSTFTSNMEGFGVTVDTLEDNFIGSELEQEYPTALSFLWTTEIDNYDGAEEFSAYCPSLGATAEASKYGHMWNNYLEGEYSFNIVLSDACLFWGSTWYGELDDGEYDWLYYTIVSDGNYVATKMVQLYPAVSAYEPVSMNIITEYDQDQEKVVFYCEINSQLYELTEAADWQLNGKDYYFSVASYADGANQATASFVVSDICGGSAYEFAGYKHQCTGFIETEPTCTTSGITCCEDCGKIWAEEDALGHIFENFVCIVCGDPAGDAIIGNTAYETLQDAINAAENGDTITLLRGISGETTYTVSDKSISLDLNGYTLRHTEGTPLVIDDATVCLIGEKGTIRSTDGISVIVRNGGKFQIDAEVIVRCSSDENSNVFQIDATSEVLINAAGGRYYKNPVFAGATLAEGLAVEENSSTNYTIIEGSDFPGEDYAYVSILLTASPENGGTVTGSGEYAVPVDPNASETIQISATANEGYTFVHWLENDEVYSTDATTQLVLSAADVTRVLVAVFEQTVVPNKDWAITFDPAGGTMPEGALTVLPINTTENYKTVAGYDYPVPTRPGYSFEGWYWEMYNYTLTEGDWDYGLYPVSWSIELVALWEEVLDPTPEPEEMQVFLDTDFGFEYEEEFDVVFDSIEEAMASELEGCVMVLSGIHFVDEGTYGKNLMVTGGQVTLNGGTYTGAVIADGGSVSITNADIQYLSSYMDSTVEINSGTFTELDLQSGTITIRGGTFSAENYDKIQGYLATGYEIVDNEDGTITVQAEVIIEPEYDVLFADGESLSNYIPIDPYYDYTATQYVIPAETLAAYAGDILTTLTYFYEYEGNLDNELDDRVIEVRLMEVADTTLTNFVDTMNSIKVFDKSVSMRTAGGALVLEFNDPYLYTGGNLLVTVYDKTGDYYNGVSFRCIAEGTAISAHRDGKPYVLDNLSNEHGTIYSYLPTTALTFENADDIAIHTISVSNTGNGSVHVKKVAVVGTSVTVQVAADQGYELESLTVNGVDVTEAIINNQYTFTMPDEDVAIVATFKELENASIIKIVMIDRYGDGWNNAQIIAKYNTNEVPFMLSDGSEQTEYLYVHGDDTVDFYWIEGTYDTECAFIIYRDDQEQYSITNCSELSDNQYIFTSTPVTIEPEELAITEQPTDCEGAVGETVTFTVAAEGEGLTYQWYFKAVGSEEWQKSWSTGYNTNTLTLDVRAYRDGQQYKCVVSDVYGESVESVAATMTLDLGDIIITAHPADYIGAVNDVVVFTVEAEGEGLTYRWQYSADGGETWQNSWSTGYSTASLTVELRAYRDGQQYRCVVTNANGMEVITDAAAMRVKVPVIEITVQPENALLDAGETVTFTVEAQLEGESTLRYRWYRSNDGGETWTETWLTGYATNELSFVVTAARAGYAYKCVITGRGLTAETEPVSVIIPIIC